MFRTLSEIKLLTSFLILKLIQEYKQKEDELTSVNVKQGFLNQTLKDIKDAQKNSQSLHDNNYLKKPTVIANREKV